MRPFFSGKQEFSNLDYYFQDGGKTGAQANQSFWKLNNIFWWSKVSHIIMKSWNFMIKSISGWVVFCFAIPEPYLLTLVKTDYPSIVFLEDFFEKESRWQK